MWAVIGAVIGFFQAIVPDVMKLEQDKRDKSHELAIMQFQLDMKQKGLDSHLEEISVTSQQLESTALQESYRTELQYSGKYSASVRPTVTYMAMILYIFQKALLVCSIIFSPQLPWLPQNAQLSEVAVVVWTAFDETLLSWIIGFWFGSRQAKSARG